MGDGHRSDWATWAEKAALRLAECEAEVRRLPFDSRTARRAKLEARRDAYVGLLARLRARLPEKGDGPEDPRALKAEVERLKERIRSAAASLIRDRTRLNDLRGRAPSGNGLDFSIPAPDQTAGETEREAYAILRRLGL